MNTVNVIIERATDGGFSAYVAEELDGFGLAGYGETASEAVEDMLVTYEETKEIRQSEGLETPQLRFSYHYDIESFFNYFPYLNISKVAERAGINPSLMRQYAAGVAKAGKRQYEKIASAVRSISQELAAVNF